MSNDVRNALHNTTPNPNPKGEGSNRGCSYREIKNAARIPRPKAAISLTG